ncbi:unnamed protein product [Schistocephalus solidus]|uniref:Reverse transcriptase domain-containing protein n=1 Tax=Schistocephalus solidus TaxID=70667 RepID=A0A183SVZ1_SCHSO|nr:unnamed protein product [Schistocephalus solidus]
MSDSRTCHLTPLKKSYGGGQQQPPISDAAIDRLLQVDTKNDLDLPPSLPETIRTVQQISSSKAPGSEAIPPEVYKHSGPRLMAELIFQEMWRQGQVPQDFKDATIVHLNTRKERRLMFSAMLMDAYRDEQPGFSIVYRTDGHLNSRRMQASTRVSTTTVHDLLYADDCALITMTEGDHAQNKPAWKRSVKTGAAIYEANRIAAAKVKIAARKSQALRIKIANA